MPIYPYMLLDYMLKLASSGKDSSDGRISIGKNSRTSDVRLLLPFQPTRSDSLNVLPPPLPTGPVIQNIAMTSYLDLEDEDWVLAVKLYGSKIKLFRRSYKPTWID
ncbi:hypothetical protein HID58_006818 [Brassica napus]|uniref:Uncharacterized protein n=1 Tax=Brassica napus TaxID=3708 RepID=A0ABQ8ECG2_BRANA|nr:hypothetical protein HID58_006818 [Brassica napus]